MSADDWIGTERVNPAWHPTASAEDWLEVSHCPLCLHPATPGAAFERVQTGGLSLVYRSCARCGLVFQSPRLNDEALGRFYQAGYRSHVQGQETPTAKDHWVQRQRAAHLLTFIEPHIARLSRHLDIGSSLGELLKASKHHYGCEAHGIEPGQGYRQLCQQQGLDVVESLTKLEARFAHSFDLVSLIHLLEHLPDPVGYLKQLRTDWVADGGFLLVEVPNLFGHPSLELAHLVAFAPTTLKTTLAASGFDLVEMRLHGLPHSRRLKLYITALARRAADCRPRGMLRRPAAMGIRRRLGLALLHSAWPVARLRARPGGLRPWHRRRPTDAGD
ncbi:MAG: class I SAM-dependent methyltransferase [Anaerolineae bacterium]